MSFGSHLKEDYRSGSSLEDLCCDYVKWVKKDEFMVFRREYNDNESPDYACFKTLKRGNDVYCFRIFKSLIDLVDLCNLKNDVVFIKDSQRFAFSPFLFVTLTYDSKHCDFDLAWKTIGKDLNLFFSNMKKLYGKFRVLRCFESRGGDGFPHVHILMLFDSKVFHVRRHNYKTKKGKYSIKYILDDKDKSDISELWHSFVDVTAVRSLSSVNYILKYITKEMYSYNSGLTSVCMILFNKRSYSISKDFVSILGSYIDSIIVRLDHITHNSNFDLVSYKFVGVFVSPHPLSGWFYCFKSDDFNNIFKIDRGESIEI